MKRPVFFIWGEKFIPTENKMGWFLTAISRVEHFHSRQTGKPISNDICGEITPFITGRGPPYVGSAIFYQGKFVIVTFLQKKPLDCKNSNIYPSSKECVLVWVTRTKKLVILLIEEILHQLVGSLSHYFTGFYIPGGAGFLPSTVTQHCWLIDWRNNWLMDLLIDCLMDWLKQTNNTTLSPIIMEVENCPK